MPALPTKSFTTIVQNITAGVQGRASKLINFAIGATLRAIAEAYAGVFLWFQAMVLQLLLAIRLSTSKGIDVDTWTGDFMDPVAGSQSATLPDGSPRLGSQYATGQVTFTRFTAGPSSCFVPAFQSDPATGALTGAGATLRTGDKTQAFAVIADPLYPTYDASLGGYVLRAAIATLICPVQAIVAGTAGNVAAGAISVITSNLQGIDIVVNIAALTNGADQESDSALKARFRAFILGLSRGDYYGTAASILSTAVHIEWSLTESYNLDGSWHPGYYFIVADDGSGNPPQAFMDAVTKAANAVRPLAIWCSVFRPTVIWATPSMQIKTLPGYDHNTVCAQVAAVIATNINGLGLGNDLPFAILASWAFTVPGIDITRKDAVSAVLLNGLSGDTASLTASRLSQDGKQTIKYATIKCSTVAVS